MVDYTQKDVLRWVGPVKAQHDAPWAPTAAHTARPRDVYHVAPASAAVGSKGFGSIQGAVDQALCDAKVSGSRHRRHIEIAPGRYCGPVYIPRSAPPLTLAGAGADHTTLAARIDAQMPGLEYASRYAAHFALSPPAVQAIADHIAAREVITTGNTAVLRIESDDTVVSGLRIENTYACDRAAAAPEGQAADVEGRYGDGQHQAVALHVAGADRVVLDRVQLSSFQDTLYLQTPSAFETNRIFLTHCLIEGDVDFIFGGATAYFQGCKIVTRVERTAQSWVTAPSTNIWARYGFVFQGCCFSSNATEKEEIGSVYLGRQWFEGVRATPYGTPTHPDYRCTAASISDFDGQTGTIGRRTLEAVGKCAVLNSEIGAHINNAAYWDDWGARNGSLRYRPAQVASKDFLTALGSWLGENGLDYSDLDPTEQWLVPG